MCVRERELPFPPFPFPFPIQYDIRNFPFFVRDSIPAEIVTPLSIINHLLVIFLYPIL